MKLLACLLCAAVSLHVYSQDTLTNKTIIELKAAGIAKSTILSMITATPGKFTTSVSDIIVLKKASVDEDVINAMIAKMSKATPAPSIQDSTSGMVSIIQKLGTGIFCNDNDSVHLKELEASVFSQSKTGSGILTAVTYGLAKTKSKMSVSGEHANLQLTSKRPVFYFSFTSEKKNFNDQMPVWFASATNPGEFLLVKFSSGKKNTREVAVGSMNSFEGTSSGIEDEHKISFKFKKLFPGIYEVYFEQDLPPGEYCFMYAAAMTGGTSSPRVYDFGLVESK